MTFVYVDEHGFVRSSEDNRILGIKTGETADGHIAYRSHGVIPGDDVDMSKISPVYMTPLPRITPEMRDLWDEYQAAAARAMQTGTMVYPSEQDLYARLLWGMFVKAMEGYEG